jgi:hypothetical protein
MLIKVQMSEEEVKQAIITSLQHNIGHEIDPKKVIVWVKSKQNYRSEWENAAIKVEFDASVQDKTVPTIYE